jgi:hypothetical protein
MQMQCPGRESLPAARAPCRVRERESHFCRALVRDAPSVHACVRSALREPACLRLRARTSLTFMNLASG